MAKRSRRADGARPDRGARPRRAEALLLEAAAAQPGRRILCSSPGRAQVARALAAARPEAEVVCHYLDRYQAARAREAARDLPNLEVVCEAELPPGERDLVVLPLPAAGEGELAREWLQHGVNVLARDGVLLAATDNPRDRWLDGVVRGLTKRVAREQVRGGVVYRARKAGDLRKLKDYSCTFAFRHAGRLIQAVSRPGVFAHRRLDLGARALIEACDVRAGERVLDVGCGSGAVAFAAAFGAPDVTVEAIDANARAVACAREGARLNGLEQAVRCVVALAEEHEVEAPCDLALANPPYYSDQRIAAAFVALAARALRPGGRLLVVTQGPDWYLEALRPEFEAIDVRELRGYSIVRGIRAAPSPARPPA